MEDYKEEIKELLTRYYGTIGPDEAMLARTTSDVLQEVRGVIPSQPIDEHDVYSILKELGFYQQQKVYTEKVCIQEADDKKGIQAEYDTEEIGRSFVWVMYQK